MRNKYAILFFIFLIVNMTNAQKVDFLLSNLWKPVEEVKSNFEKLGFDFQEKIKNGVALSIKMTRDLESLTLNFGNNSTDSLTSLVLVFKEVNKAKKLISDAKTLEGFNLERKFLIGYTSFVFMNSQDYEVSIVKMPDIPLNQIYVACYPFFDDLKNDVETNLKYDETKDLTYLIRKLVTIKNSKGQSLEDNLKPIIQIYYNQGIDLEHSINTYRSGESFDEMKKIVEDNFLNEKSVVVEMKSILLQMGLIYSSGEFIDIDRQEKLTLEMMIDNELYGSLIMLKYLTNRLKEI